MPKKKKEEMHVQLIVEKIVPDRTPYKVYGLAFLPLKMMVSIPIDAENITILNRKDGEGNEIEGEADYYVLNLDGLMQITGRIADAIDELHGKHMEDLQLGKKK